MKRRKIYWSYVVSSFTCDATVRVICYIIFSIFILFSNGISKTIVKIGDAQYEMLGPEYYLSAACFFISILLWFTGKLLLFKCPEEILKYGLSSEYANTFLVGVPAGDNSDQIFSEKVSEWHSKNENISQFYIIIYSVILLFLLLTFVFALVLFVKGSSQFLLMQIQLFLASHILQEYIVCI
ncbi:MAG: hypothetical protein HWE30_08050 [Methylocystaceae bacterium]|nr:hypothetical protein [Methylocystaceae bacterium]